MLQKKPLKRMKVTHKDASEPEEALKSKQGPSKPQGRRLYLVISLELIFFPKAPARYSDVFDNTADATPLPATRKTSAKSVFAQVSFGRLTNFNGHL
jgi:hypothetical protein